MKKKHFILILICILAFSFCEDKVVDTVDDELPPPNVPGKNAVAGNTTSLLFWFGIDSDSIYNSMKTGYKVGEDVWISGRVVPDETNIHGFYLDPSTIEVFESADYQMRSTVGLIKENPGYYAQNGKANSFTEHAWALKVQIFKYNN